MFSSKFCQRLLKHFLKPKNFIINLEVKVGDKYAFIDKKVVSRFRSDAINIAIEETKKDIKIIYKGSKSLGKVEQFNNEF